LNHRNKVTLDIDGAPLLLALYQDGDHIYLSMPLGAASSAQVGLEPPTWYFNGGVASLHHDPRSRQLTLEFWGAHALEEEALPEFTQRAERFIALADELRLSCADDDLLPAP
jgi:hypothetical protein